MSIDLEVRVQRASGTCVTVRFSEHALQRLAERLWQLPSADIATPRLMRLLEHAQLTAVRPAWLVCRPAELWVVLGDVAFPVTVRADGMLVTTTCLVRGTQPRRRPSARLRRRRDRRRSAALRCPSGLEVLA